MNTKKYREMGGPFGGKREISSKDMLFTSIDLAKAYAQKEYNKRTKDNRAIQWKLKYPDRLRGKYVPDDLFEYVANLWLVDYKITTQKVIQ